MKVFFYFYQLNQLSTNDLTRYIMESIVKMIEDALRRLREFFAARFEGDKEMEELAEFLKTPENRFNPDGTVTDEYKEWIQKVEEKISGDTLDEMLIESAESPEEADAIRSIIGFVDEREELMQDYRKTILDYDQNADEWMKARATEGLDEQAREVRIKTMEDTLASEDDIIE